LTPPATQLVDADLSTEERAILIELIRRRKEEAIRYFTPNPGAQEEFIRLVREKREVAYFSGNKSGKTFVAASIATIAALGPDAAKYGHEPLYPDPQHVWVGSVNYKVQREAAQIEIERWVPVNEIKKVHWLQNGIMDRMDLKNGGTIGFKTYDQGRLSWQGPVKGFIWCIAEGSQVQMASGGLKNIEDIRTGDEVLSLDHKGQVVKRKVLNAICQGEKDCLKLTPKFGTPMIVTPDHDIFHGYRKPSKLPAAEATRVAQPRYEWFPEDATARTDAWYIFAALVISEGYVKSKKITNGNEEVMQRAINTLPRHAYVRKKIFDPKTKHVPDWFLNWSEFWDEFPLGKADSKEIPEWVFTSPKEKVRLFLRWLYFGDGWAHGHIITYVTTSARLAEQLSILLSRFGIRATLRIRKSKVKNWKDQYWVSISKAEYVLRFIEQIGIEGKELATQKVCEGAVRRFQSIASRGIPAVRSEKERAATRLKKRRTARIVKREDVGKRVVYDITVEGEHRFLLGTNLVSNCDEEAPMDIIGEARARLTAPNSKLIFSLTPLLGVTKLYKEFVEDKSEYRAHVFGSTYENKANIDKNYIKTLENLPEDEKQMRLYGQFTRLGGLVYPEFDKQIHVIPHFEPDPRQFTILAGMDFGADHPTAFILIGVDVSGQVYVFREYKAVAPINDHKAAFHRMLLSNGSKLPVKRVFADPSARQASIDLRQSPNPVITYPGNRDRAVGISLIRQLLKDGDIMISDACPQLIYEFEHHQRKDPDRDGGQKDADVKKTNDDLLDSCRYVCASHFKPKKPEDTLNALKKTQRGHNAGLNW
jgi:phage terminase large subunit-like protein